MSFHHRPAEHAPSVPVVDLTASAEALRRQITWLRTEATELIHTGVAMRDHADKLEQLLGLLSGGQQ